MHLRRFFASFAVVLATAVAIVPAATAQNNSQQTGLVNVSLGDVAILNNVNLAVAANIAATVCDVNVPIAVLAQQVVVDGTETICTTTAGDDLIIDQALPAPPGGGGPNAGGNNSQQEGLVNVSLGDVNVLNDVNLAVVANIAATVCDLDIAAAVLAVQGVADTGGTVCTSSAGDNLTITQAQ